MSVYDRWWKTEKQPDGSKKRVRSKDYGCEQRWQVRWRDEDKKQCAKNFTVRKGKNPELHAEAFDALNKTQLDTGTYVPIADANTTFRAFAEDWRKARAKLHDVTTAERIERQFRLHVYPVIGQRPLRELAKRPSLIRSWISGIKLAPGSARKTVADVSSVFIAAMDDGLIGRNPLRTQSVTWPAGPDGKVTVWTLRQVDAMAEALAEPHDDDASHRPSCGRYGVIPYLGTGTGMRQGEMFGIAVDDIDFLRKVVHVRRQVRIVGKSTLVFSPLKNDKVHSVPLWDSLAPILAEHIRLFPPVAVTLPWEFEHGEPATFRLLLTRPSGIALNRQTFNKDQWKPALSRAGIEDCRENGCHAMRHTAASAWLEKGVDVATVAKYLGDTVATVVKTYLHPMAGADDHARMVMNGFFAKPADERSALDVHRGGI